MPSLINNVSPKGRNLCMIRFNDKFGAERSMAASKDKKLTRDNIIELIEFSKNRSLLDLEGRDISHLDLSGLDLRGCSFREAYAVGTIFNNSNLSCTDFENAHVYEASLRNANTDQSNIKESGITFSTNREKYAELVRHKESELSEHYFGVLGLNIRRDSNGIDVIRMLDTQKITRNRVRMLLQLSRIHSAIPDFSGMDMSLKDMSGLDFSNAFLNNTVFTCSSLVMSNLDNATINRAYMNVNITNAKILNVNGISDAMISGLQADPENYQNVVALLKKAIGSDGHSRSYIINMMGGVVRLCGDQIKSAMRIYEKTMEEDKRYQIFIN